MRAAFTKAPGTGENNNNNSSSSSNNDKTKNNNNNCADEAPKADERARKSGQQSGLLS